ncbi:MAG: FMN-binding protein [Ruminococcaceae bacterium]|nr:FMN-binding protein [Oscillospiraceae bacterium]
MKESIKCVIVITAICLVIAAALGLTNYFTKDTIEKGEHERTQAALKELIPEGAGFEEITDLDKCKLPQSVTAVYKETSGIGYVFKITTKGYSNGLVIMCAVSTEGKVIKTSTLANNETPTIGGDKVVNDKSYTDKYIDTDASTVGAVDTVSGATVTSKAYRSAISDALAAFAVISAN